MTKIVCICFVFLFGWLTACQQQVSSDTLLQTEACMEAHPDSALLLLHRIPHPQRLSGKQRADYALLLTQARDKNFLDSLQSDSLIKIAVDYYRDSKDDAKAGKSFFYYGKVLALQDNDTLAMQAYLNAQQRLERTREYKMRGLVEEHIGMLKNNCGLHSEALTNYRQSVNFYFKAGDTLGVIYGYRNIAWRFKQQQLNDSAFIYLNQGIALLKGDTTAPVLPSLLQLQGIWEGETGDYSNAVNHLLTAIKHEKVLSSVPFYYFALGEVYMQMKLFDKAEECFEQGLSSPRAYTQFGACQHLYLLEKEKANYTKALLYKEQSDSLFRIYQNEKSAKEIIAIQHRCEKKELQIETELMKQKKQNQIYLWMLLSASLLLFGAISYPRIKKKFKNLYRKRMKRHIAQRREIIMRNEQAMQQLSSQLERFKQHDLQTSQEAKAQIGKLKRQVVVLQNQNKEIGEMQGGYFVLEELKANKLTASRMTSSEFTLLFEYIDLALKQFSTRLKKEYNLNKTTLLLAVCIRLDFSIEQLTVLFDCEQDSIYRKKSRLKEKLSLKKEDNLEAFLKSYPGKGIC